MIQKEDGCIGCPKEMGCLGDTCPMKNGYVMVCDECGNEVDELYEYDNQQVCFDCLLDIVGAKKVEV